MNSTTSKTDSKLRMERQRSTAGKRSGFQTSPWGMTEKVGARAGRRDTAEEPPLPLLGSLGFHNIFHLLQKTMAFNPNKRKNTAKTTQGNLTYKMGLKAKYFKFPSAGEASERGMKKGLPLPFAHSNFLPPIETHLHTVAPAKSQSIVPQIQREKNSLSSRDLASHRIPDFHHD